MDAITLKFRYTKQDYISAMHLHNRKKFFGKQSLPVFALILGGTAWFYSKDMSPVSSLVMLLGYIALYAGLLYSTPYRYYNRKSKFFADVEFEFSEEDVRAKSELSDSRIAWKLYEKVVEDDNNYLLYMEKLQFHIIPKRVFESRAQEQEFRELLARKITSAQILTRAV